MIFCFSTCHEFSNAHGLRLFLFCFALCFVTFRGRLVFPMFEPGATTITKHKRRRRRDRKTCSSSIFLFYYFLLSFFPLLHEARKQWSGFERFSFSRRFSFIGRVLFFLCSSPSSSCVISLSCRPPTRSMSGCVNPPQREIVCVGCPKGTNVIGRDCSAEFSRCGTRVRGGG